MNKAKSNSSLLKGLNSNSDPDSSGTISDLRPRNKSKSSVQSYITLSRRVNESNLSNQLNKTIGNKTVSGINLPKSIKRYSMISETAGPFSYPQPTKPPRPNHRRNVTSILSRTSNNMSGTVSENSEFSTITPSTSIKVPFKAISNPFLA